MDMKDIGYFLYMEQQEQQKRELPTCGNCKYLDECPAEYQEQEAGYCENWEPAQKGEYL